MISLLSMMENYNVQPRAKNVMVGNVGSRAATVRRKEYFLSVKFQ